MGHTGMASMEAVNASGQQLYDEGAEKAVLGICLMSPNAIADLRRRLSAEDFYLPAHQSVFAAMCTLDDRRDPVEPIAAWSEIVARGLNRGTLDSPAFLADLVALAPAAASASYYANLVKNAATVRALAAIGARAQQSAAADTENPALAIERLRSELDRLADDRLDSEVPTLLEAVNQALEEVEQISGNGVVGVPTGFVDLDAKINGLAPGQLVIVAGRPGLGKSTLALDFARHAALKHHKAVLFFSLEMSRQEVMLRLISAEARVELGALRTNSLENADWRRVADVLAKMDGAKFGVIDTPSIGIADIRARARAWKRTNGLDMIVVDYLQLMQGDRRAESRQQEVSEISRSMKLIAKEFGVPVVALSQLNRSAEQRADKRPAISDLRESGSLEQDSDVVLLVHRDEAYNQEVRAGEADIIIAKQRNGPQGTVTVTAQLHYSRFTNRMPDHH